MSPSDYRKMLKVLHLEGYAESYEDAEYILESISDDEFYSLYEAVILNPKIISHLISEGYTYSEEQAEEMLIHMSEDWKQSILESKSEKFKERLRRLQQRSDKTDEDTEELRQRGREAADDLNAATNRYIRTAETDIRRHGEPKD